MAIKEKKMYTLGKLKKLGLFYVLQYSPGASAPYAIEMRMEGGLFVVGVGRTVRRAIKDAFRMKKRFGLQAKSIFST